MNVTLLADCSLLGLFRGRWADFIYERRSFDNGNSWSEPTPTTLPNNNSSSNGHLALQLLKTGNLAMLRFTVFAIYTSG